MSKQQHTPDMPWIAVMNCGDVVVMAGRKTVANCNIPSRTNDECAANAARIVACVNYCVGTSTDDLNTMRGGGGLAGLRALLDASMAERAAAIAQRDALAEALAWCLPHVEEALAKWGNVNAGGSRQAIAKARAALAKLEGKP